MSKSRIVLGLLLIGLVVPVLAGCSKVNKENYDKIETGMTFKDVEGILGEGTEKAGIGGAIGEIAGSGKVVTWGDEKKSITVTFANDKVVAKAQKGL
jgi:hypothetical protein